MPLALTAGSQMRVRKVLREIGVPTFGGEQQVVVSDAVDVDVFGDSVEPGLADAEGARLVVFGVALGDVTLAGGGVGLGDLDDGLLDGERSAEEVDVSGFERDERTPAQPRFDEGLDHQPVLDRQGGEEPLLLVGGEGAGLATDDFGQLGVVARVVDQHPVLHSADEDRGQQHVVLAHRSRGEAVLVGLGSPVLDQGGGDPIHLTGTEEGVEVLVDVGHVPGTGAGLDLLVGQPLGLDVLAESDLAECSDVPK